MGNHREERKEVLILEYVYLEIFLKIQIIAIIKMSELVGRGGWL